jgi:hypothetical protein
MFPIFKDLVTIALKSSVRSEFCKYQEKIDDLQQFAEKLKSENETLRQYVDQDVLLRFQQQRQKLQQQPLLPEQVRLKANLESQPCFDFGNNIVLRGQRNS